MVFGPKENRKAPCIPALFERVRVRVRVEFSCTKSVNAFVWQDACSSSRRIKWPPPRDDSYGPKITVTQTHSVPMNWLVKEAQCLLIAADPCDPSPCNGRGLCMRSSAMPWTASCDCYPNYNGTKCEKRKEATVCKTRD